MTLGRSMTVAQVRDAFGDDVANHVSSKDDCGFALVRERQQLLLLFGVRTMGGDVSDVLLINVPDECASQLAADEVCGLEAFAMMADLGLLPDHPQVNEVIAQFKRDGMSLSEMWKRLKAMRLLEEEKPRIDALLAQLLQIYGFDPSDYVFTFGGGQTLVGITLMIAAVDSRVAGLMGYNQGDFSVSSDPSTGWPPFNKRDEVLH